MIRTVISLDQESKDWLDRRAREEKLSMAELIRTAVQRYRDEKSGGSPSMDELLKRTSGMWKAGDALAYQRRIREQWQRQA